MPSHKWTFSPRFRRNGFGWRSELPIRRIKEALTEIRQAARFDSVLGAEGAIVFLEKLSPSLMHVDSSSGALGTAVYNAIETLVPLILAPAVSDKVRQKWLSRLWRAIEEDEMPYIEHLGDFWGDLCVTPEIASFWVDELLPSLEHTWAPPPSHVFKYYCGTSACLSAMVKAKRYEELLAVLETAPRKCWRDRVWGVKALLAMGNKAQALSYAESMRGGLNEPESEICRVCEDILLSSGLADVAYERYGVAAAHGTNHLAVFKSVSKKYPHKAPADVLNDLVKRHPGAEGKWFAAAKDARLYDVALDLARKSPTDPRTLTRAARDFVEKQPAFAANAGLLALHWLARGHGWDITGADIDDAYETLRKAALAAGLEPATVKSEVQRIIDAAEPNSQLREMFRWVLKRL